MSTGRDEGRLVSKRPNASQRVVAVPVRAATPRTAMPVLQSATPLAPSTTDVATALKPNRTTLLSAQAAKPALTEVTVDSALRSESGTVTTSTPILNVQLRPVEPPRKSRVAVDIPIGLANTEASTDSSPHLLVREGKAVATGLKPPQLGHTSYGIIQQGGPLRTSSGTTTPVGLGKGVSNASSKSHSVKPETPSGGFAQERSSFRARTGPEVVATIATETSSAKIVLPKWRLDTSTKDGPAPQGIVRTPLPVMDGAGQNATAQTKPPLASSLRVAGTAMELMENRPGMPSGAAQQKHHVSPAPAAVDTTNSGSTILPQSGGAKKQEQARKAEIGLVSERQQNAGSAEDSDRELLSLTDDLTRIIGALATIDVCRTAHSIGDSKVRQYAVDTAISEQLQRMLPRYHGRPAEKLLARHLEMAQAMHKNAVADWGQAIVEHESQERQ